MDLKSSFFYTFHLTSTWHQSSLEWGVKYFQGRTPDAVIQLQHNLDEWEASLTILSSTKNFSKLSVCDWSNQEKQVQIGPVSVFWFVSQKFAHT